MLAAGGIAYYNYINHREAFLVKDKFRSLEELSQNVSNTTKGYVKLLEPFVMQATQEPRSKVWKNLQKNPSNNAHYAQPEDSRCFSRSPVSFSKELERLEPLKGLQTYFELVLSSLCSANKLTDVWLSFDSPALQPFPIQSSPFIKESEAITLALSEGYRLDAIKENALQFAAPPRPRPMTYRLIPETDAAKSLRLELMQEISSAHLTKQKNTNQWATVKISARFRLDTLLEELVIPEAFTDVIIADEGGQVILHRADPARLATTRFERLDTLLSPTLQGAEPSNSTVTFPAKGTVSPISSPLSRLPIQQLIQIGESDYYVFAQALTIDLHDSASVKQSPDTQPLKLIIAGLVSADEFHWSAKKIPNGLLLVLICAAFALPLALPLIKLKSMGPRDRLGLLDAFLCMFSSIVGTALLTLALGAWTAQITISDSADAQLKKGAGYIKEQFEKELKAVVDELNQLRGTERSKPDTLCPSVPRYADLRSWDRANHFLPPESGCRGGWGLQDSDRLGGDKNDRFLVHMALWIRPDGEVARIETIQRAPIVTTNLKERPYLRDIWNGTDLLHLGENSFEFSIQPVLAWNDGEFATMIAAKAISLPDVITALKQKQKRGDYVVAIRVPLRALTGTVLPAGYGYSVIDKTGLVLYDSDKRKNLRENLFRATDDNQELKGLVSSGTEAKVRTTYRGYSRMMYVTPLRDGKWPWTLVVHRDTQWLDWVTNESLFFAIATFSIYALVIIVIGLCVSVFYPLITHHDDGWIWPSEECRGTYHLLSLVNIAGIGTLLWGAGIRIDDQPLVAVVIAVSGVVLLAFFIMYVLKSKVSKTRTASEEISQNGHSSNALSPQVRWAYSCMATTTILVLAVIPASTFLTIGVHRSLSLYESYAGHTLTERAEACIKATDAWSQRALTAEQLNYYQNLKLAKTNGFEPPLCTNTALQEFLNQPNITDWSDAGLNEKHRSLMHLWMWEPGKQLGGWIGHNYHSGQQLNPQTFSPVLFAQKLPWWSHIVASIFVIVVILAGARLFERGSVYRDVAIYASIGMGLCVFGVLAYFAEEVHVLESSWLLASLLKNTIVVAGLVTTITYCTQRIVSHYLLLMDFQEPMIVNKQPTLTSHKHILIVVPPIYWPAWINKNLKLVKNDSGSSGWHLYDIPQHIHNIQVEGAGEYLPLPDKNGALALTGFDFRITEHSQARIMLQFMERLALEPDRPILLIAYRHPFDPELMSVELTEVPSQDRMAHMNRERWACALRNFLVIPFSGREHQSDHEDIVKKILANPDYLTGKKVTSQCKEWADFVRAVEADQDQGDYTRMRYAFRMMRCYYEYLWAQCTKSEKLALAQIASNHFLHVGNSKLYPLIWKGFVKLRPQLQLCNKSFQTFVLQVSDRDDIYQQGYDLKPSVWAKASRPLFIGLISSMLFLGVTQESVRDVIIAFAPILPAFLLELPKLLGGAGRTSTPKVE